jgi:hypothetical protein
MTYRISPIDIDFAGWCEVPEGKHNAWGVIDGEGGLRGHASTETGARRLIEANGGTNPNPPR